MNETRTHPHSKDKHQTRTLRTSVTAAIPRPVREVFDYLSALEHNPDWNWSVTATTSLTPGPLRPGSRYLQASMAGPDRPQALEVIRVEPPHLLEVESIGSRLSATYVYELQTGDRDATEVTVHAEVRPRHPVGLPRLYLQRLEASIRGNLDNLRSVLKSLPPEYLVSAGERGESDR